MPMAIRSSIMTIPSTPTAATAQPGKRRVKDFLANGSSRHLIWQRTSPNQYWCDFTEFVGRICDAYHGRWILQWWQASEKRLALALDGVAGIVGVLFPWPGICWWRKASGNGN